MTLRHPNHRIHTPFHVSPSWERGDQRVVPGDLAYLSRQGEPQFILNSFQIVLCFRGCGDTHVGFDAHDLILTTVCREAIDRAVRVPSLLQ